MPADTEITSSATPTPASHGVVLQPGEMIGDYRVESKIGHGGMGTVYAAIHPVIEKRVAIKVLRPELSESNEAIARFVQEARAVNRIRHPAIVDVFGYGTTEDGRCFLVMEHLEGESLAFRIEYDRPKIDEACDLLIAITHALDAAHASGIVHRDLKPDNVFLLGGRRVKLLDFGIAKLTAPTQAAPADYTQPGQAIGTPRYIAPEQARGDTVDGRTDIYSLGVMAFELFVGRLPFVGDNAMELVAKHIAVEPPRPSSIEPTLPVAADTLLLEMLDKTPSNRPTLARVRELIEVVRMTRRSLMLAAVSPATTAELLAQSRRTRWWIPVALATLLVGGGIATWQLAGSDELPAASLPPPPFDPPRVEPVPASTSQAKAVVPTKLDPPPPAIEPPVAKPEQPRIRPRPPRVVVKRPAPPPHTLTKPKPLPPPVVNTAPVPPPTPPPPPAKRPEDDSTLKRPKIFQPKQ